jgi:serine protease Do
VVEQAERIRVRLRDGRQFDAEVKGTDEQSDLAVLQLKSPPADLPIAKLGDSDKVRVGEFAIAIGAPFRLDYTVTFGHISAKGRNSVVPVGMGGGLMDQDFIQTDASINFGNSGGPLCNIRGEAIGVNTAINTSGQGIGFAVPINLARHVAEQLIAHGTVKRAMMGVTLANMTPDIAEGFGLDSPQGVLIQSVFSDSPADRAGLRRNDVIVELNGQPVSDRDKFRLRIADTPPGTKVRLGVLRDGRRQAIEVTLTDRDDTIASARLVPPTADEAPEVGFAVRELTDDERREMRATSGVRVTTVNDGSEAQDKDIQAGDVIEEVNRVAVNSVAEFRAEVAKVRKAGKPVVLIVNRGGMTRFETLKLDK